MEFLSKEFNSSGGAVNLVLQSPESVRAGYDASKTHNYRIQNLPFQPDGDFHEYRFDWSPASVIFFVDGRLVYEMTENIPSDAGRFFINHWSNGDPLWSAGPPQTDTVMTISYMKAYFNSSDAAREKLYRAQCPKFDLNKVCEVPNQSTAPQGADAETYFFSADGGDKTPGQVTFQRTNGAIGFERLPAMWAFLLAAFTFLAVL
jgi:beta-glucanase (GH16 family)